MEGNTRQVKHKIKAKSGSKNRDQRLERCYFLGMDKGNDWLEQFGKCHGR